MKGKHGRLQEEQVRPVAIESIVCNNHTIKTYSLDGRKSDTGDRVAQFISHVVAIRLGNTLQINDWHGTWSTQ